MHGNAVIFHMAAFLAQCGTKTWVSLTESASAPFLDSRVRGNDTAWHPPFSHLHHTSFRSAGFQPAWRPRWPPSQEGSCCQPARGEGRSHGKLNHDQETDNTP